MEALRRSAPVPITFEAMAADTDGYFSADHQKIAIRQGMSEVQTVSATVHEIAHSKLHDPKKYEMLPLWKVVLESEGGTKHDFESSTSRYSSYISLFRFALKRLFSVLTLVFDILTYFVLYVARGCLGNIRATIVFRATLFGTTQGKLKICTEFEDLAIFQSKSFFFVWRFYREKHKFCCRKWRFYPQNARVFCCAE